ncbi:MAG: hypothetical protein GY744_12740 [Gammaproteobacteria bacterium]|nr:hypothetical protein [Gammaproteobacteria bacterium]
MTVWNNKKSQSAFFKLLNNIQRKLDFADIEYEKDESYHIPVSIEPYTDRYAFSLSGVYRSVYKKELEIKKP